MRGEYDGPDDFSIQTSRELVGLAITEATRLRAEGDLDGAWRLHEAVLRFSAHLGRAGGPYDHVVAGALRGMDTDELAEWSNAPDVSAEKLGVARRVLGEVERARPSREWLVKVEYVYHRRAWSDARRDELEMFLRDFGVEPRLSWIRNEPELALRVLDHCFAHQIAIAGLSWRDHARLTNDCGELRGSPRPDVLGGDELREWIWRSKIATAVVGGFIRHEWEDRDVARFRALDAALAAEIFRRERGRLPRLLVELVPDLLADVPVDPFQGPADPLRYEVRDDRPVVWSIGADGIDDGGRHGGSGTFDIGVRIGDALPHDRDEVGDE